MRSIPVLLVLVWPSVLIGSDFEAANQILRDWSQFACCDRTASIASSRYAPARSTTALDQWPVPDCVSTAL